MADKNKIPSGTISKIKALRKQELSADVLAQAVYIGPKYGFNISSLPFVRNRSKSDALTCASKTPGLAGERATGLELCERDEPRDRIMLVQALLDAFVLSRSTVLVGSMMSNFPRLALQLRVQAPLGLQQRRYLPLDDREWCTRSSCRMNYTERFGTT